MTSSLRKIFTLNGDRRKYFLAILFMVSFTNTGAAQSVSNEPTPIYYNGVFIVLCIAIVLLLMVIVALSELVKSAAKRKSEREKKSGLPINKVISLLVLFGFLTTAANAQPVVDQVPPVAEFNYWGIGPGIFSLLLSVISFEIWVAWSLYRTAMELIGKKAKKVLVHEPSFIEKLNASVAVEEEKDILLDHNYDGIQELDNNLPPWWKYGFYVTIVFAFVYLFNFHFGSGKLQFAEYQEQMDKAKIEQEEYRKKAANLVDENNATVLTDAASLAAGHDVYKSNCAACHGQAGEGGVGPNLTDDYWLHKGGIKDIFRSIKLGWPEKGMKSWQQDLGAKQIHEVASFIMSLHGTNPANAKEKQGELYSEGPVVDSTKTMVAPDSLQVVGKDK